MKKKIGTVIEENTMRLAKRKAAEEGRSLSDVIQDDSKFKGSKLPWQIRRS